MTTHTYHSVKERDRKEALGIQWRLLGSMVVAALVSLVLVAVAIITGIKFGLL